MGAPRPSFTLGIEEEFQIVDPQTRALKAHIQELFAAGQLRLKDKIKREFHQSVIEVGTGICRNIAEARAERVDETVCLAALFQAITVKLWKLHDRNLSYRLYSRALISENKYRAARFGIDGKLIDFGKKEEVPFTDLLIELLEFVDDVLDELGSRKEVEYVHTIVERKTGADRQLEVFERTRSLPDVVDYILTETRHGLD